VSIPNRRPRTHGGTDDHHSNNLQCLLYLKKCDIKFIKWVFL
jgi:hypothetical protein